MTLESCGTLPLPLLTADLFADEPAGEPVVSGETTMAMQLPTDRALMERIARADSDAFAALYRRYERPLFGFLYRLAGARPLAEDLLQETFTRVWVAARTYDPARGAPRPWLYKVALNVARTELVKKRYTERPLGSPESEPVDESAGEARIAARLDQAARTQRVARAVAALPDFLREVVVMRCHQQLSFAEIAEVTGAPEGTLKARFHRAVAALRAQLGAPGSGA